MLLSWACLVLPIVGIPSKRPLGLTAWVDFYGCDPRSSWASVRGMTLAAKNQWQLGDGAEEPYWLPKAI